jgi:surface antigen
MRLKLEEPTARGNRHRFTHRKSTRRKAVRYGLLAINCLVLIAVVFGVWAGSQQSAGSVHSAELRNASPAKADHVVAPLDQISSADIAVNVARATGLPEAVAATNQADSLDSRLYVAQPTASLAAKPQVVATDYRSNKDIQTYKAKSGDSVQSVADTFGLKASSIKWSNGLSSDALKPGQKLYIPPVNGIVYVTKKGDTAASLASKFQASKAKIIAFNDAELKGLKPGERLVIPGGKKPQTQSESQPGQQQPSRGSYGSSGSASFPWGGHPVYGYNGYDYGYCTWYVANQLPVPSNWGNANTWDNLAPRSGWHVSAAPRVGSIAQTDYAAGGLGHVAIVRGVSSDGSKVKISDMNGLAGWGNVGVGWVPTSEFQHYISR